MARIRHIPIFYKLYQSIEKEYDKGGKGANGLLSGYGMWDVDDNDPRILYLRNLLKSDEFEWQIRFDEKFMDIFGYVWEDEHPTVVSDSRFNLELINFAYRGRGTVEKFFERMRKKGVIDIQDYTEKERACLLNTVYKCKVNRSRLPLLRKNTMVWIREKKDEGRTEFSEGVLFWYYDELTERSFPVSNIILDWSQVRNFIYLGMTIEGYFVE